MPVEAQAVLLPISVGFDYFPSVQMIGSMPCLLR
jgi:hypothetical protein